MRESVEVEFYSATRNGIGKRQEAKVYLLQKRLSLYQCQTRRMRSAIPKIFKSR
ncbi:MAG: hypothetical protein F6J90_23450 [Moorea sp. SIOASIH]|nr:hypothetical protein [Moorena sp. SIOASIH]